MKMQTEIGRDRSIIPLSNFLWKNKQFTKSLNFLAAG